MSERQAFYSRLARQSESRIVLLVLDGVGDLRTETQPRTALELAQTPNLDALAQRSALGRLEPVAPGITPGSGPGHLALFGYDPRLPECDIGRGVLEALGLGLALESGTLAARANFASIDAEGRLTDRRAGRIPTQETVRLCRHLNGVLETLGSEHARGLRLRIAPGEGYRFVLLVDGPGLDPAIHDTDPQQLGVAPRELVAADPKAADTVERLRPLVKALLESLKAEVRANSFLLRGFSTLPQLPSLDDLYGLRAGAFAGYPLYRGVASVCGMRVFECGKTVAEVFERVATHWSELDYVFAHVKQTDMAGEDGDLNAKVAVLEEVDRELPRLLELGPDVLAITGDHSTPAPMKAHSWHPVPLLLFAPYCFVDSCDRFDELAASRGYLGTLPSSALLPLLLANAGKLRKYGA